MWSQIYGYCGPEYLVLWVATDTYHHAVEWLGKAKAGYGVSGRQAEWLAYYQQLVQTHGRKYKLMGLLQKL
jgi:uncharacterized Zn finger protein